VRFAEGETTGDICVQVTTGVHRTSEYEAYAVWSRTFTPPYGSASDPDDIPTAPARTVCTDEPLRTTSDVVSAWFAPGTAATTLFVEEGEEWSRSCHSYTGCSAWTSAVYRGDSSYTEPVALVVSGRGIAVQFELVPDGRLRWTEEPLVNGMFVYHPEPLVGGIVRGHAGATCLGYRYERPDEVAITAIIQATMVRR
jgi:hypothetical protein